MEFLRKHLDQVGKLFEKGKPLEKLYPLYEAGDTFAFTPGIVTKKGPHVRDVVDLKRTMVYVVVALIPCILFGIYNVGYQMLKAQGLEIDAAQCWILGLQKVLPIILVTYLAGGFWEVLFAVLRRHEINEGFLVTGMLYALIMSPAVPLWQVAVGISFGVVFGKEIFGGTGMNVFNPAIVGRAFVFFAYPASISGSNVWVAVDGYTRATPLAVAATTSRGGDAVANLAHSGYTFDNMLWGFIPGSIGETSAIACVAGLIFLLITGVASWRTVLGCVFGLLGIGAIYNLTNGANTLGFFSLPAHWHLVMGGFAFGAIFMATDPVSSAATNAGRWIFGIGVGALTGIIRVINPAYPEGVMLAILLMNLFAPLIDHFVVEANIAKRLKRVKVA